MKNHIFSLYDALYACASASACNGVNKVSSSEYYLMKGTTVEVKKGRSCYIQGGTLQSFPTFQTDLFPI